MPTILDPGITPSPVRADETDTSAALRRMKIGSKVTYQGRTYVLRGLDPMSVPNRRADLRDPETGERIQAPLEEVKPASIRPV